MNSMLTVCLIALIGTAPHPLFAKYITKDKVRFENKDYYADLIIENKTAELWFREMYNQSTSNDKKILTLNISNEKFGSIKKQFCDGKKVYDNGKTIVGCLSVAGAVGCLMGTVATDGATAMYCSGILNYANTKGIKDCLTGIIDEITAEVGASNLWSMYQASASLKNDDLEKAIDLTINELCNN